MALSDLFNTGLQIGDWYQTGRSIDDAEDYVKEGFDQGRTDVQNYADPWAKFGKWGRKGYKGLGEFGFDYDNYLNSDNYDWMRDEGMRGINRTGAASHALGSGNTLDALVTRNQNYAQSQYGQEHARQLAEFGANKDYYNTPIQVGADASKFAGQYLSDMAIGEGGALAGLEAARSANLSSLLGSPGAGEGAKGDSLGSTIVDAISWVGGKLGLTGDAAVDYVSNALGISPTEVSGALGAAGGGGSAVSAADFTAAAGYSPTGFGTGTGFTGAGAHAGAYGTPVGGSAAELTQAGVSPTMSGVGSTLMAASPLIGFGAIIALDQILGGGEDPQIVDTLKQISQSKDPLKAIGDLSGFAVAGLFSQQYYADNDPSYGKSSREWRTMGDLGSREHTADVKRFRAENLEVGKGVLYSTIIGNMNYEQYKLFAEDPNYDSIMKSIEFANSHNGNDIRVPYQDAVVAPREALQKLDKWSTKRLVSIMQTEAGVV